MARGLYEAKRSVGLSQESLKIIACVTMLIDHIGAILIKWQPLRMIGRISFPIFCFLIAEGCAHTSNPQKYGIRLAIGAAISEFAFDLALYGGINLARQNVMITLLLGFLALQAMAQTDSPLYKFLILAGAMIAGQMCHSDYGGNGVLLVVMFGMVRDLPRAKLFRVVFLTLVCLVLPGRKYDVFGLKIHGELFALAALLPIHFYSGEKKTHSKLLQWGFYLFYPAHLLVLYGIKRFFF